MLLMLLLLLNAHVVPRLSFSAMSANDHTSINTVTREEEDEEPCSDDDDEPCPDEGIND